MLSDCWADVVRSFGFSQKHLVRLRTSPEYDDGGVYDFMETVSK